MQDSVNYINTLISFYDKCVRFGAVRVSRTEPDLITCRNTNKKFFHFTSTLAINIKSVCWIFPNTALKNLDKLKSILKDYDTYLCTLRLIHNGTKIRFYIYNYRGKLIKRMTLKYCTINLF